MNTQIGRKAHVWLTLMALGFVLVLVSLFVLPRFAVDRWNEQTLPMRTLARDLALTDLCISTEARYLRHLSQADFHSSFQDNPLAFDYFPSGSLVLPPYFIWGWSHEMAESPDSLH